MVETWRVEMINNTPKRLAIAAYLKIKNLLTSKRSFTIIASERAFTAKEEDMNV